MRLRQVLINLLSNAIKFTPRGEVVLELEHAGPTARQRSAAPARDEVVLHFRVRDIGIGIPADRLDRLFKSFGQVDTSITRAYGGTGLGLAISKRLVERMGGQMWVDSAVGVGSVFHCVLTAPATPAQNPIEHKPPLSDIDPQLGVRLPLSILLAEDNPVNQRVALLLLGRLGYRADVAVNGTMVLSAVEQRSYDVILMDVQRWCSPCLATTCRAASSTINICSIARSATAGSGVMVSVEREYQLLCEALENYRRR